MALEIEGYDLNSAVPPGDADVFRRSTGGENLELHAELREFPDAVQDVITGATFLNPALPDAPDVAYQPAIGSAQQLNAQARADVSVHEAENPGTELMHRSAKALQPLVFGNFPEIGIFVTGTLRMSAVGDLDAQVPVSWMEVAPPESTLADRPARLEGNHSGLIATKRDRQTPPSFQRAIPVLQFVLHRGNYPNHL